MTSAPEPTVISVRGDASITVDPDSAVLRGRLRGTYPTQEDALGAVAASRDSLVAALSALGGVVRTARTGRVPLSWSVGSLNTDERADHDEDGRRIATTSWWADAGFTIVVRDFTLLQPVSDLAADIAGFSVGGVDWEVDDDNGGWPRARADAIGVALARARDYAAALGLEVDRVAHVADAGLLGTDAGSGRGREQAVPLGFGSGSEGGPGLALDPVPQRLRAVIEARVHAVPAS